MPVFERISSQFRKLLDKKNQQKAITIVLSIVIAIVPVLYVYNLLFFSSASMPGADPAVHIVISRWVARYHSIFVPYSQFLLTDVNLGYYPAFFQSIIAVLHYFTNIHEVILLQYFMLTIFLIGVVAYHFLSKLLSNGKPLKGLFVYFLLLLSTAPIIKTMRDGSYGEIIAIWLLLPLFLYFFLRRRLLPSITILVLVLAVHNLSATIIGALIIAFLIAHSLQKEWESVKFTFKMTGIALVIASPLIYYFYFLTLFKNVLQQPDRSFVALGFFDYSLILTNLTFYVGITCLVLLLVFYKQYRWLALWFGICLILGNFPMWSARIVRWMTVPLALSMGIVLYDIIDRSIDYVTQRAKIGLTHEKHTGDCSLPKNVKIKILAFFLVGLIIAYNGVGAIQTESNPIITNYFTTAKAEAYNWLNEYSMNVNASTIVIRGFDTWARVYLNNVVYEVVSPAEQTQLSVPDMEINDRLTKALMNPFTSDAFSTFEEYNISYFVLSTPLPQRWYYPETVTFVNTLFDISYETTSFYKRIYYDVNQNDEIIKIYEISFPQSP